MSKLDENLDEILAGIAGDTFDYAQDDDSDRDEAVYSATKSYKPKIKQLFEDLLDEVIGEDIKLRIKEEHLENGFYYLKGKNHLRDEQRQRAKKLLEEL